MHISLIPRPSCSVKGGSGDETIVHTAVLRVKDGDQRVSGTEKVDTLGHWPTKHLNALHHSLTIHGLHGYEGTLHVTYNICPWTGSIFK